MAEELTAEERERLRKVSALGKVSLGIALKWIWLFILVFSVLFLGFAWFVVQHSAKSPERYVAETRLMYIPHGEGKVPSMGDKQLYRVLERRSLKRKAGENLPLPPGERARLAVDLNIKQENKPSNVYTLTAKSGSRDAAVRKVNAYADTLVAEYGVRRTADLLRWGTASEGRKASMREELAKLEEDLVALRTRAGTDAPVETLASLMSLISEQRRNAMMLDVDIAATEKAREAVENGQDGEATAAILARGPELRKLRSSIEALDGEIAKLRQIYTDLNPRVMGKLEDRAELEEKYRAIVEECGGIDPGTGGMEQLEKAQMSLLDATTRLEALHEARADIGETLARNEARAEALSDIAPQVAVLTARKAELARGLDAMDAEIAGMKELQESAGRDLAQIERAANASQADPFRPDNFVLAGIAAAGCTVALALWTVAIGLFFGRVRGAGELGAHGDIRVLGSLPGRWAMRQDRVQEAVGVIANHFIEATESAKVVLVCRMKGAKPQPKFDESLEWSLSMAGTRPFFLTVVPQEGGGIPEDETETMLNTVRQGARGWFPVLNRYSLAPTELQMFKADLAALREEFDCIFVAIHGGLRHGGDFMAQLLGVCDAALLLVGANRTRRSELAYVRRLVQAAEKPMMGLVTGARGRVVRKELEESRW